MTIGLNNRNDAIGNGAASEYPYGFKIFAATDLHVTVRDPDTDAETTLTYPTHYSVSGIGSVNGGLVTLTNGGYAWLDSSGKLDQDWAITIRRVRPLTQETDLRNQDRSNVPQDSEDEFDRQTMIAQQQQDELDRAFKLPESEAGDAELVTLPFDRADMYLAFDANKKPRALPGSSLPVSLSAYTATARGASIARALEDFLADRVSVLDYIPANLHAGIRDGSGTTPVQDYIRDALEANRGRTVFMPSGVYYCNAPLLIGGPGAVDYHSLEGEGPAIFADNAPGTPRTILYFSQGSGVVIANRYQRFRTIAIIGTSLGGADPTTGVLDDLQNVGLALSHPDGTSHGGYSNVRDVPVSNFDVGVAVCEAFLAYSDLENISTFSCDIGWVLTGAITDLHIRGGVTVDCGGRGWYVGGSARVTLTDHLLETSGQNSPNKNSAAVCVHDLAQFVLIACGLQDNTHYFCDRGARLELLACNPVICKFFGPGEFLFHDSLGRAIDIPVPTPDTWTLSNVTVGALSSADNPACYSVTSSEPAGAIQMHVDIPIADWGYGLDPAAIAYEPDQDVKHFVSVEFSIRFEQDLLPASWSAAEGFFPAAIVFGFDGSQDGFEQGADTDISAWDFTDGTRWHVNLCWPLTWVTGLTDTIEKLRILVSYSDGAVRGYDVHGLQARITDVKATFFQRNAAA